MPVTQTIEHIVPIRHQSAEMISLVGYHTHRLAIYVKISLGSQC